MPLQASSIWTLILQYCLSQKHAESKTDSKILVAPPQSTAHDKMQHPIPTHHPLLSPLHTWQELVCQFGDCRENREEKLRKLCLLPWGSHAPCANGCNEIAQWTLKEERTCRTALVIHFLQDSLEVFDIGHRLRS